MKIREHLEDLGIDGRITLECILKGTWWEGVDWIHLAAVVANSCEHGNETLISIKGMEFLDQLGDYQLFKDSAPWNYLVYNSEFLWSCLL